jgi:hypothetical protein
VLTNLQAASVSTDVTCRVMIREDAFSRLREAVVDKPIFLTGGKLFDAPLGGAEWGYECMSV